VRWAYLLHTTTLCISFTHCGGTEKTALLPPSASLLAYVLLRRAVPPGISTTARRHPVKAKHSVCRSLRCVALHSGRGSLDVDPGVWAVVGGRARWG
jgi:hypothetical protein